MAAAPAPLLRIATRGSLLATTQAQLVADMLGRARACRVELVVVETTGDRRQDAEIWQLGGQGVFVKEVQAAVLDGRADAAVHSAKDLPSATVPGLVLAAVPERADPRDVLVGSTFAALPTGARIGTGSVRRRAQLAWLRPDLTFAGLRGNIDTRLGRASDFEAVVLAAAGLMRLGRQGHISDFLDTRLMVPQVGQGALALECRVDDDEIRAALATVEHRPSRRAVDAERSFLAEVGGGCDRPVGAHATAIEGDGVRLSAMVATLDGRIVLRHTADGDHPVELGRLVARHLLDDAGGSSLQESSVPGAGLSATP